MNLEKNVPLQPYNTFGIAAKAHALVRVRSEADLLAVLADPQLITLPRLVLGGGSNMVLTGDVKALVLKVEVPGMRLVACLLYTSPSPRDLSTSRMPSSA